MMTADFLCQTVEIGEAKRAWAEYNRTNPDMPTLNLQVVLVMVCLCALYRSLRLTLTQLLTKLIHRLVVL